MGIRDAERKEKREKRKDEGWIPASAGMTTGLFYHSFFSGR
jgi:hypothetical protein